MPSAKTPYARGREAALRRLPKGARRRLGRIKRAVLDQPEPAPKPKPTPKPTPKPEAPTPTAAQNPPGGWDRIGNRRKQIFTHASSSGRLLEIGPAHNGTIPRRDGFDTKNVDYLDRAGLVDKYKDFAQYDPDDIEEVDYVLGAGTTFASAINDKFDLVLASHVLEHSISLIDFINDLATMLAPGGQLALVVPDHRFCFDRLRERTSLGSVIEAAGTQRTTHTPGTLIEFSMYACKWGGRGSWPPRAKGEVTLNHSLEVALANGKKAEGPDYIDVHHWIFSPNHLRLMLNDLADLGFINVRETHFHPTIDHEFFLNLAVDGSGPDISREELIELADAERRTMYPVVMAERS